MTAVVGILNKQAVALAADSAVTIGGTNGRKILNKANKVFSLSNVHPIGIMIYNSASFMATPWETIINVYRKQLGKTSFSSLKEYQSKKEYQSNFIEFIRSKNFYTDSEMQLVYLKGFALDVINSVIQEILKDNHRIIEKPDDESRNLFLDLVNTQLEKLLLRWKGEYEKCNEFDDYTFEMFQTYSNSVFAEINQERFIDNEINISSELLVKIKEVVYYILIAKEDLSNFTGLIFSGFGEQEIYPQLISINISMVIDNRLRYYINGDQCASISNENNGAICPFAQTDVINTILSGIDPSLDETYLANFHKLFKKYNEALINMIGDTNDLLKEQIENLDTQKLVENYDEMEPKNKIPKLYNSADECCEQSFKRRPCRNGRKFDIFDLSKKEDYFCRRKCWRTCRCGNYIKG